MIGLDCAHLLHGIIRGLVHLAQSVGHGVKLGWRAVGIGAGFWRRHRVAVAAYGLSITIILAGTAALVMKHTTHLDLLEDSSSFALVLTLAFLVLYTYYTRQLARSDYEPLAGFWLASADVEPDVVLFMIHNHCKRSLDCWSRVEATVRGQTFQLRGFYGGEYPFFVQPLQTANGNFSIGRDVVTHCGFSRDALAHRERETGEMPVHLKVSFGYGLGGEDITWLPPAYYYYSLAQQKLVLDVGAVERKKCGMQL